MNGKIKTLAACVITALVVGGGAAEAGHLIRTRDIAKDAVTLNRLSPGVRALIAKAGQPGKDGANGHDGTNGANGRDGAQGIQGSPGTPGATGATGANGLPGAPGEPGTNGGLPSGFWVTNTTVGLTKTGVAFGPYADGGAAGGSLYYNGLNGKKLSDVTDLGFTFQYTSSDGSKIATPYLRIFLNGNTTDVVLDPSECNTVKVPEDTATTLDMATFEKLRYDDDQCGPDYKPQALDAIQADHGDDEVSGIYVSQGFAGGTDVGAKLTGLTVNGQPFTFGG